MTVGVIRVSQDGPWSFSVRRVGTRCTGGTSGRYDPGLPTYVYRTPSMSEGPRPPSGKSDVDLVSGRRSTSFAPSPDWRVPQSHPRRECVGGGRTVGGNRNFKSRVPTPKDCPTQEKY